MKQTSTCWSWLYCTIYSDYSQIITLLSEGNPSNVLFLNCKGNTHTSHTRSSTVSTNSRFKGFSRFVCLYWLTQIQHHSYDAVKVPLKPHNTETPNRNIYDTHVSPPHTWEWNTNETSCPPSLTHSHLTSPAPLLSTALSIAASAAAVDDGVVHFSLATPEVRLR